MKLVPLTSQTYEAISISLKSVEGKKKPPSVAYGTDEYTKCKNWGIKGHGIQFRVQGKHDTGKKLHKTQIVDDKRRGDVYVSIIHEFQPNFQQVSDALKEELERRFRETKNQELDSCSSVADDEDVGSNSEASSQSDQSSESSDSQSDQSPESTGDKIKIYLNNIQESAYGHTKSDHSGDGPALAREQFSEKLTIGNATGSARSVIRHNAKYIIPAEDQNQNGIVRNDPDHKQVVDQRPILPHQLLPSSHYPLPSDGSGPPQVPSDPTEAMTWIQNHKWYIVGAGVAVVVGGWVIYISAGSGAATAVMLQDVGLSELGVTGLGVLSSTLKALHRPLQVVFTVAMVGELMRKARKRYIESRPEPFKSPV
ncbi:hypothetical protein M408DRAFT_326463 [Serendipita vermifera MAFF 305830]|uniref:Uncharacterized protein n=1 Tax=Serendipita vermifera MAFF 305830 TaxID=933852 RepID=A0A0C2XV04_SERVB|nr:hypothetical protein M408DRAFT_326463 [Serendipita vermifera MAFF 305830]